MKAVILAGGLGTRLRPFTEVIPKPLLPLGESSVLEIQLDSLQRSGIRQVFVATNFRADYVEAFLGDGSRYGIELRFSRETKPLGTCGPILLLKDQLTEPFLLMNGDVLTRLDFADLFRAAERMGTEITVATTEVVTPFNFGKVVSDGDHIVSVEEKPDFRLEILAGIYVLRPSIFDLVPPDTYYGIDSLIKDMIAARRPVGRYPMKEYWLDIGRINDYDAAREAYKVHFEKDEPGAG